MRVPGAWPALVDQGRFDQVEAKLSARAAKATHSRVVHSEYIVSGLIKCGACGASVVRDCHALSWTLYVQAV